MDFKMTFSEQNDTSFNTTFKEIDGGFKVNFSDTKEIEVVHIAQSDWNETDSTKLSFIKNKPETTDEVKENSSALLTSGGAYQAINEALEKVGTGEIKILDGSDAIDDYYYNAWELEDGVYLIKTPDDGYIEVYLDNSNQYTLTSGLIIISTDIGVYGGEYKSIIGLGNEINTTFTVCGISLLVDNEGTRDDIYSEGFFASEIYVSEKMASIEAQYKDADTQFKRFVANNIYDLKNFYNKESNKLKYKINSNNGKDLRDTNYILTDYIYLEIGTYQLTFSDEIGFEHMAFYYDGQQYKPNTYTTLTSSTLEITYPCYVRFDGLQEKVVDKEIMLVKGDTLPSEYIPYQVKIKEECLPFYEEQVATDYLWLPYVEGNRLPSPYEDYTYNTDYEINFNIGETYTVELIKLATGETITTTLIGADISSVVGLSGVTALLTTDGNDTPIVTNGFNFDGTNLTEGNMFGYYCSEQDTVFKVLGISGFETIIHQIPLKYIPHTSSLTDEEVLVTSSGLKNILNDFEDNLKIGTDNIENGSVTYSKLEQPVLLEQINSNDFSEAVDYIELSSEVLTKYDKFRITGYINRASTIDSNFIRLVGYSSIFEAFFDDVCSSSNIYIDITAERIHKIGSTVSYDYYVNGYIQNSSGFDSEFLGSSGKLVSLFSSVQTWKDPIKIYIGLMEENTFTPKQIEEAYLKVIGLRAK